MHLIIIIQHKPYDINPFILYYEWYRYLSFSREREKPRHIKPTYLSNYLKNIKQNIFFEYAIIQKKSDQIMAKEAYLQIILSLKFKFDILLSHKINL